MIELAQLREALTKYALAQEHESGGAPSWSTPLYDAARVLLAQREAGALIITPDENGIWPNQARRVVADFLMLAATVRRASLVAATEVLDALRDAMPDGET